MMCLRVCSTMIATRIIRSIFITFFHWSRLASKLNENGSVVQNHAISMMSKTVSRVAGSDLRSFDSSSPTSVAPAMAAATGMLASTHE